MFQNSFMNLFTNLRKFLLIIENFANFVRKLKKLSGNFRKLYYLFKITFRRGNLPRRESGVSLASGIYEEIPDLPPKGKSDVSHHVYENPIDVILHEKSGIVFTPPPLPPRQKFFDDITSLNGSYIPFKQRCNTLPAKDLSRISQIFTSESDYMVMSPSKTVEKKIGLTENLYMPMSPIMNNIKTKIENCYMVMSGKKT